MITNRVEYKEYLLCDLQSYYGHKLTRLPFFVRWFSKQIKFIFLLRKAEFYSNCSKTVFGKLYAYFLAHRLKCFEQKIGYTIPINVLGKGTIIVHIGTVVINPYARIGDFCRIHVGVNIGTEAGKKDFSPTIGDRCYIGPGAKIFGKIIIGNDCAIGANSVVNKSFPECGKTICGVPAQIVSNKGSRNLL